MAEPGQEDVKSHHYIIALTGTADNGLTVDRAQELGRGSAPSISRTPGSCLHPRTGHSHTENIRMHIVINSLRIAEVMLPHGQASGQESELQAPLLNAAMNYHSRSHGNVPQRGRLYQIDVLNGGGCALPSVNIGRRKEGQAALDKANAL